jgi:hypothetical protein
MAVLPARLFGRCEKQTIAQILGLSRFVIPGRAKARTWNLEMPGSMRCIDPE